MKSNPFIRRIIGDFQNRNRDFIAAHDARLDSILSQVDGLSSPHKEEKLVELILSVDESISSFPLVDPPEKEESSPASSAQTSHQSL